MLKLDHLRKSFGSLVAVDDLSLEVVGGEVFGLLGPNGAGKSTTIGMAIGLLKPDQGSVSLDGAGSPADPAVRRKIGVAPQSVALYDDLTAEENLRFFGRLFGLGGSALRDRVLAVLNLVGLEPRRRDRVKGYSGGMKRRLNLAAALIHDPPLLLLDEPTAGVDPQSRNNILELVTGLAKQGRTIVYTTHYMEEAQRLCSRVAIMDKGKILCVGSVDELIASHGGKSVVTIERDGESQRIDTSDPLSEIARVIGDGKQLRGVRIDRPDLESVFLAMTGRSLRD
ncbi:Linearmycin resistance ATP-binding protein LnrL [Phycisphaerales bacterium]|nr:Linearmycin resistance ATP-binding protein LnrL [Phycisphaerales bacterium]